MTHDEFVKLLEERGDAVYILDRGLVRFIKFASAIFAVFGIVGFFFFGIDLKKASDEIKDARLETKKSSVELKETLLETKNSSSDFKESLAESKKVLADLNDAKKQLSDMMRFISESQTEINARLDEIRESARGAKNYEQQAEAQLKVLIKMRNDVGPTKIDTKVRIALVSETKELNSTNLSQVAAALQKQVSRDIQPIWNVDASIEVFGSAKTVPEGTWPVIVKKDVGTPGASSLHLDNDGKPFALVTYSSIKDEWTLGVSHELLGMLVDPHGDRTIAGPSANPTDRNKIVNYLVEIGQPVEAAKYAYRIDGILVSDFVTPEFYSDKNATPSTKYSFTGAAKEPRKILKDGYLSWQDKEDGEWHQATWFDGAEPTFRNLGKIQ